MIAEEADQSVPGDFNRAAELPSLGTELYHRNDVDVSLRDAEGGALPYRVMFSVSE